MAQKDMTKVMVAGWRVEGKGLSRSRSVRRRGIAESFFLRYSRDCPLKCIAQETYQHE